MTGWHVAHIGFETDDIQISGYHVWKHEWRDTKVRVRLAHPAYPKQIHEFYVYEIGDPANPLRFAATDLSPGVWGFYVPDLPH